MISWVQSFIRSVTRKETKSRPISLLPFPSWFPFEILGILTWIPATEDLQQQQRQDEDKQVVTSVSLFLEFAVSGVFHTDCYCYYVVIIVFQLGRDLVPFVPFRFSSDIPRSIRWNWRHHPAVAKGRQPPRAAITAKGADKPPGDQWDQFCRSR